MSNYKRGKFLQGIFERAINDYRKSEEVLKQSLALKYHSYLSICVFRKNSILMISSSGNPSSPDVTTLIPNLAEL